MSGVSGVCATHACAGRKGGLEEARVTLKPPLFLKPWDSGMSGLVLHGGALPAPCVESRPGPSGRLSHGHRHSPSLIPRA